MDGEILKKSATGGAPTIRCQTVGLVMLTQANFRSCLGMSYVFEYVYGRLHVSPGMECNTRIDITRLPVLFQDKIRGYSVIFFVKYYSFSPDFP